MANVDVASGSEGTGLKKHRKKTSKVERADVTVLDSYGTKNCVNYTGKRHESTEKKPGREHVD